MNEGRYKTLSFTRVRADSGARAALAFALAAAILAPLAVFGAGPELSVLAERFFSGDIGERIAAGQALSKAGPSSVAAVAAAGAKDARRHSRAVEFIGSLGPKAIPALLPLLSDPAVRNIAGAALFRCVGPESAGFTGELLACAKDPAVANYCGAALVQAMSPKAKSQVPKLAEALKDPDPAVRAYAAAALGQIGPKAKAAVPALAEALKDATPSVRATAARALGKFGSKAAAAAPLLEALSQDPDSEVRQSVGEALGKIRG